jgi:hypothetical protein
VEELACLDRIYLNLCEHVLHLRAEHVVARHLQLPKLPSALSEGIVACTVARLFGRGATPVRVQGVDLGVAHSGSVSRVGVKGTGKARWVTITPSDLKGDYLVWVDYTCRLTESACPVDLWTFATTVDWLRVGRATLWSLQIASPTAPGHNTFRFAR